MSRVFLVFCFKLQELLVAIRGYCIFSQLDQTLPNLTIDWKISATGKIRSKESMERATFLSSRDYYFTFNFLSQTSTSSFDEDIIQMTVNAAALSNCFSGQNSHIIINQDDRSCMYRLNFFIQFSLMLSHMRSFLNFVLSHIPWNMITIVVHVLMINDQQDRCSKLKWRRFVCADTYILLTCVTSLSLATIVQLLSLRLRWKINILINRQKSSYCCNYSPFMPIQYVARFSSHYPHHIACLLAVHKRCLLFSISKCSGVDFLLVPFFSAALCVVCALILLTVMSRLRLTKQPRLRPSKTYHGHVITS